MNLRTQMARLKRKLFKKPFLKDKRYPPYWFDQVLGRSKVFLVQIGSNDGKTGDPFHQLLQKNSNWKALFVEPVPYLFERLKSNYADQARFSFANVAINEGNRLTFYWLDPAAKDNFDDLPFWYDQLGSFDKQHIINELGDRVESYIFSKELEGIRLPDLLSQNQVDKIDILHIDTEGYDWKILSQLDLKTFQPKFILYECNHLSKKELADSYTFLKDQYELFDVGIDVLAVNKKALADYLPAMVKSMKSATGL
jgi:FkbM family methyltransferase